MATVDWIYPAGNRISGTSYIKETDNNIQDGIDDLVLWVNSDTDGTVDYTTTGLAQSMVDVTNAQTVAGVKTFTDNIIGDTAQFYGQVTTITPIADTDATNKKYVDDAIATYGVSSGTYTPTLTNGVNVDSSGAFVARYLRVGDIVSVDGVMFVNATASGTKTIVYIDLPIAPTLDFTGYTEASGTAVCLYGSTGESISGNIYAEDTSKTVSITFNSKSTGNDNVLFSFSYKV